MPTPSSILGLDVGDKRIGVAVASLEARLPRALRTVERAKFFDELPVIVDQEGITQLIVGLPRNLSGQATTQTQSTEAFVEELRGHTALPITLQDEALTSKQAEAELQARGKTYEKGDIDALAAVYILEDFLAAQTGTV